jgi:hypothetical protein
MLVWWVTKVIAFVSAKILLNICFRVNYIYKQAFWLRMLVFKSLQLRCRTLHSRAVVCNCRDMNFQSIGVLIICNLLNDIQGESRIINWITSY